MNIPHLTRLYPHNTFQVIPWGRRRHWAAVLLHQGVQWVLLQLAVSLENTDYQLHLLYAPSFTLSEPYDRVYVPPGHLSATVHWNYTVRWNMNVATRSWHCSMVWQMPVMSKSNKRIYCIRHIRLLRFEKKKSKTKAQAAQGLWLTVIVKCFSKGWTLCFDWLCE